MAIRSAPAQATSSLLRDSQLQQASIQARVHQIDQQIAAILDEFARNGLSDAPEVKTLRAVRSILSSLSSDEMDKVVALLHQASDAAPDASRPLVSSAYARQKSILAQLDQLLLEFHRQQTLAELSQRFAQLAQRQQTNLKAGIDLARQTNQRPHDQWENPLRESQNVQQQEQSSLKTDIAEAIADLNSMTQTAAPDAQKILRPAADYAKSHALSESAAQAADDLAAANLFRAAGNEKKIRDDLRRLARLLSTASADKRASASRSLEELDQAISEQSTVAFQVLNPKTDLVDAEQNQAAVVDQVDPLKSDLADVSQPAAQSLARAQEQMQEARAAMNEKDRDASAARAKDALDNLQKAHDQLQTELAKAQTPQPSPKPVDAQALKQLQNQRDHLADLIKQQQSLNLQTGQSKPADSPALAQAQQKLADSTKADQSPPLQDAHAKMQSAASNLQKQDPASANADQQAALADLMQAKRNLDAQLSSSHPNPFRDSKTLDQIAKELSKAQEQLDQSQPSPQSLAATSKKIGQLTADDQGALPDSAEQALEQSRQSLRDAAAGKQSLSRAQESLAKAQAAVALAKAQLTSQALSPNSAPPTPPPPTPPPPDSSSSNSSESESSANSATANESQPSDAIAPSRFLALPPRDRAALLQSNTQTDPPQFAPQIQQYRRNLAGEGQ